MVSATQESKILLGRQTDINNPNIKQTMLNAISRREQSVMIAVSRKQWNQVGILGQFLGKGSLYTGIRRM